jgi:hypothetical protein
MGTEKTISLMILIILITYIVLNMSFFDANVIKMTETFDNTKNTLLLNLNAKNYKNGSLDFENASFSQAPISNGNHLKINGQKLIGELPKDKMNIGDINDFSIMIKCSPNNENTGIDGVFSTQQNTNNTSSFSLYRDNVKILDISIPSLRGSIKIKEKDDNEWKIVNGKILPLTEIIYYTFIYKSETSKLEIYYNDVIIDTVDLQNKIILSYGKNENIQYYLNNDEKWKTNLYFLRFYNGSVNIKNIISQDEKNKTTIDDGSTGKNGHDGGIEEYNEEDKNKNKLKKKLTNLFLDNLMYNDYLKMRLHERFMGDNKTLLKMNEYRNDRENPCRKNKIKDHIKDFDKNTLKEKIKKLRKIIDVKRNRFQNYTPDVFYRNKQYFVIVFIDSNIHINIGYYGTRSYGKSRRQARNIFISNFPGVPLPAIFDDNYKSCFKGNYDHKNCPFVINYMNPCDRTECQNVNWKQPGLTVNNLNTKCRESVNHYCNINAYKDDACVCWRKENANTKRCVDFRSQFQNKNLTSCSVDIFNIEDHPNFNSYVRKDSIPCYGCNL